MEILRVENLCKNYGKGETLVKALDNVSFTAEKANLLLSLVVVVAVNQLYYTF